MVSTPGLKPGPNWWEACALTIAPPLLTLVHAAIGGFDFSLLIFQVRLLFIRLFGSMDQSLQRRTLSEHLNQL